MFYPQGQQGEGQADQIIKIPLSFGHPPCRSFRTVRPLPLQDRCSHLLHRSLAATAGNPDNERIVDGPQQTAAKPGQITERNLGILDQKPWNAGILFKISLL